MVQGIQELPLFHYPIVSEKTQITKQDITEQALNLNRIELKRNWIFKVSSSTEFSFYPHQPQLLLLERVGGVLQLHLHQTQNQL